MRLVGLAMVAVCALPRIRATIGPWRGRLWTLITVALASHLVLDSWNSYGVHPFWPIDSRWYYGDAVFILEPWIWTLLGVAVALNTVSRVGRGLLAAALAGLVALGTLMHVIPLPALLALVVTAAALVGILITRPPRARAAIALALAVTFVAGEFALREVARAKALATLEPSARARIVDVVLSPSAANPLCWSVLTVVLGQDGTAYAMTQGGVAVLAPSGCGRARSRDVEWQTPHTQSLAELRALYRADCWVRGWMQFGRAPKVAVGAISDERYGASPRGNFTTMLLKPPLEAARCPANLTAWRPPRADLLGDDLRRNDEEPR